MWNILYFPSHSSHFSLRFIKLERRAKKIFPDKSGRELWQNRIHSTMGDRSSLRDTTILEHYGLRERFSWKVVFVVEARLLEKKRCGWTLRHCSRIDAPRRLSSLFWIFSRGLVDGFHKSSLTDLCVLWSHPSPRVANWRHHEVDRATGQKERDRDECKIEGTR